MLVVKIELHSARTGEVKELHRAYLYNDGSGGPLSGNYVAEFLRRRSIDRNSKVRTSRVKSFPRKRLNAWHLLARALRNAGY